MLAESRPRILVVDDERVVREVIADFLTMEDFTVRTAADGGEALRYLDADPYDLVLSDLMMPGVGGLELLEKMRARQLGTKTVIMTGFGTVESAIDAMKAGASDYILKPFRVDEVVLTVRRALEERRLEAENVRLREAVALFEATEKIATSLSLEEVLTTVADAAAEATGADGCALFLRDDASANFDRAHWRGKAAEALDGGSLAVALDTVTSDGRALRLADDACAPFAGPSVRALLALPFLDHGERVGILAVVRTGPSPFDEGNRKLLAVLADRGAAAVANARLYANLQGSIEGTLEALATAIDKLDPYTAGHSDRVATYAGLLAEAIALPPAEVEHVRRSAAMHDIGKIGCHLNLNKPGKLTAEEYEEFKKHPVYGREILAPIRSLRELLPGVHLHHERMDGHGYPLGLPGTEIPLLARIICIADSYDAMTSDRAYRKALTHEAAVAELRRCAGTQFDGALVEPFVTRLEAWREARAAVGEPYPA
ncbi:MAG: HD domain-containing phosphohydrolase [Myxococcota bacterium]